ncbi:hypothetical protein [Nonlabens sp. Asnod2-A12]|uniref:hypothetical protein n=1 Tax=Nonlabens sp. Asnod2-A12 TaxID=3160578 RepID=UPI0038687559
MKPLFRNIIAVIAGWLIGSTVNMGFITLGHSIYPIEGLDPNDMEDFAQIMPTLDAQYFIFPFLAHALGTLVGAIIAALIAANHKMKFALVIGILFLLGGIAINIMLPGPLWFTALDIIMAYIPMAFIGGKIALNFAKK